MSDSFYSTTATCILNITIPICVLLYREYGCTDTREIKLMAKGRKKYETTGTLHFASIRYDNASVFIAT